ncbi:hypothetical protein KSF_046430 [Reticulibacter mediterranei]|uniref:Transposase DDE domain-containing protein n=1 Tax=Reticulibacter mediterranei TaxID=2778369 RepID=A0A8J3ILE5_9CHLR|nr:hypothetical protein [Reticulibacter mediterranei]GHO94595.1 hypothetical protein KSF_046430 [Reticulibacter mediterranei]
MGFPASAQATLFPKKPEESTLVRTLYDCPDVPVGKTGCCCRVVVATHPAGSKKSRIGQTRKGVVYELFFTQLPQDGFTASDVVALYLHRGAFEPMLSDEDEELDPDRWCSHSSWGQEAWQIVAQWTWNVRLELGHQLAPEPLRTTEFAPALPPLHEHAPTPPTSPLASGYAPPATATSWKADHFTGADFPLQPDGTLRCPAGSALLPHEYRREADESLRVVYGASIRACRPCPLREQCQWNGSATTKPRQVSILLHPLSVGAAPLRLRGTGIGDTSSMPVCVCIASTWRSRWNRPSLDQLLLPHRRSLVLSGRIPACYGRSGSLAMPEHIRLVNSPSSCSTSRSALRAGSA